MLIFSIIKRGKYCRYSWCLTLLLSESIKGGFFQKKLSMGDKLWANLWGTIGRTPSFTLLEGESEKLKKKGVKVCCQGRSLKRVGLALFLFNFSRFIIFTFRNYFTLQDCVIRYKKKYFSLPPYFYEKSHSKLPKNEPVCMCKGWGLGSYSKYSKREWNRKEGRTNKIKKRGGALKKGAGTNPLTNYGGCSTWKDSGTHHQIMPRVDFTNTKTVIEHCKLVDFPQPWWDILLKITPHDRSVEFRKDSSWRLTVKWFQKLCSVSLMSTLI